MIPTAISTLVRPCLGPIDVLQIDEQRRFVSDQGGGRAVGGGGTEMAAVVFLTTDRDGTDPGEQANPTLMHPRKAHDRCESSG